jgi:hypothetical protein
MPFKDCLDFSISLYIAVEFPVCEYRPDILASISQFLEINVISKTHPPLVKENDDVVTKIETTVICSVFSSIRLSLQF